MGLACRTGLKGCTELFMAWPNPRIGQRLHRAGGRKFRRPGSFVSWVAAKRKPGVLGNATCWACVALHFYPATWLRLAQLPV